MITFSRDRDGPWKISVHAKQGVIDSNQRPRVKTILWCKFTHAFCTGLYTVLCSILFFIDTRQMAPTSSFSVCFCTETNLLSKAYWRVFNAFIMNLSRFTVLYKCAIFLEAVERGKVSKKIRTVPAFCTSRSHEYRVQSKQTYRRTWLLSRPRFWGACRRAMTINESPKIRRTRPRPSYTKAYNIRLYAYNIEKATYHLLSQLWISALSVLT